ncbi:arylesterase [Magnetospirillum aberrantis SpK]|uniref:Arylesterase n=2 Tax=Magnetospirillum TaxID=13134 RepID=A0A7C9UWT1_9PROT|nr:arylesterase [Magnetospirillum aberrantis SpK]
MRLATLLGNLVRYGAVALIVNAAPAMAEPFRLLALGDSLTAGYGVAAADSFPAQLERALRAQGHDVTVINAGVSGDTSAGGKARLDWSLGDRPNAAIVELGANDGLRGLDVGQMEANLDNIVGRLKGAGIKVLLTGMRAPPNYGADYAQSYAAVFPRVARRHQVAFYPFFLEGVARDPRFNQPDGLHPTALGVAEIVRRMLPEVTALLKPEEKK